MEAFYIFHLNNKNIVTNKLVSINIDQVDNAVINSLVEECNTIILGAASNCNLLHENNMSIQTVNNCNKQPISLFVTMFLFFK
jgi:hypothetical protein